MRVPRSIVLLRYLHWYAYLLQLLVLQITPHHHLQHNKQLPIANIPIAINIIHPERKLQLLLLVALGTKSRQPRHELLEVDVAATVLVENGNHACGERVRGDLRQSEEFVAVDGAAVVLVELHEALAQAVDFFAVD
jgi:hypothetical protein